MLIILYHNFHAFNVRSQSALREAIGRIRAPKPISEVRPRSFQPIQGDYIRQ